MTETTTAPALLRCSAMSLRQYENRVRVLFGPDGKSWPVYGLEMDTTTYRAIPLTVPATPDTFRAIAAERGDRAPLECRPDYLDQYTAEEAAA